MVRPGVLLVSLVACILLQPFSGPAQAQTPTGTIVGVVTDGSAAAVAGVQVHITNSQTQQGRIVTTSTEGQYVAELLQPGVYWMTVEAEGFKRLQRTATVEAGTATTVDLALEIGDLNETVTVRGSEPLLHLDHHQIAGVVRREQIDNLPLNGRNFLELAKLEPGVTNPARLGDNRTFMSSLGSGLQTIPRVGYSRVTVDGANIVTAGTAGVLFQVSQDVVQEFQIATVNFDQATSLSSNGAINIVTRSGGNDYRGGFLIYRDHNLAAYPGLGRDPNNPDPFFRRAQFGFETGGPIRTDRVFFFGSYERHDQRGVGAVNPGTPEFAPLGGIFPAPYLGDLFSVRTDVRLHSNHTAFARYTHDGNRLFGAGGPTVLPSAWQSRTNRVAQSLAALTSVLSSHVVNDVRLSYFDFNTVQEPATVNDCQGCFGLGERPITIAGGAGLTFGSANKFSFGGRRSRPLAQRCSGRRCRANRSRATWSPLRASSMSSKVDSGSLRSVACGLSCFEEGRRSPSLHVSCRNSDEILSDASARLDCSSPQAHLLSRRLLRIV
jgi:Carboxypeptidase regulatory-like domain